LLDQLRALGLDTSRFGGTDQAAVQQLAAAYRQLQQVAPYAQAYAQNREWIEAELRQRQIAAQQQAQQRRQWWQLPEWNERWSEGIYRDPQSGEYLVRPGYPPDLVDRARARAGALQDLQNRFWSDPEATLGPMVQHVAAQVAQQIVAQHLGGYQENSQAADYVAQNSGWLHARDANGQLVMDRSTGMPQLSEWGNRFLQYVRTAEQYGIRGVNQQRDYALGMVQRDYYFAMAQNGAAAQNTQAIAAGEQQKANLIAQAQAGAGGRHVPGSGAVTQPGAPGRRRSLQEVMQANMLAGGFAPGQAIAG
jgi:hypothetical protein